MLLDLMWKNLATSIWEALSFLAWLVPALSKFVKVILSPILIVLLFAWLVLFAGWKQISETLIEKWTNKGWEKEIITSHNARFWGFFIATGAHLAILAGFILNFVILVSISAFIFVGFHYYHQLISQYPELMRDFRLLIG